MKYASNIKGQTWKEWSSQVCLKHNLYYISVMVVNLDHLSALWYVTAQPAGTTNFKYLLFPLSKLKVEYNIRP